MEKQRCEKCGSTLIYIRITKGEKVCRSCGHIEKLKKEQNGEK